MLSVPGFALLAVSSPIARKPLVVAVSSRTVVLSADREFLRLNDTIKRKRAADEMFFFGSAYARQCRRFRASEWMIRQTENKQHRRLLFTGGRNENCAATHKTLTLSLPRVINFKFLLQPHQKYNITQYEELSFS